MKRKPTTYVCLECGEKFFIENAAQPGDYCLECWKDRRKVYQYAPKPPKIAIHYCGIYGFDVYIGQCISRSDLARKRKAQGHEHFMDKCADCPVAEKARKKVNGGKR